MGERIGAGGFSVVYRARQQSMNREVAIKVLNTGFATDAERRTFERECHALGRLSHHPNIVTVFDDAITDDGRPCIVMELYSSTYRERRRGDRAVADRRGARRRRAHLRSAPDRPRRGRAAPRHQAAQHLPVRVRRAGARRLRDLHDRRRAQPQRRERGVGRLRGARGARGQPSVAGGRRVLAGGHAVPVDRRRVAVRERRHEDDRAAGSSPRTRRRSVAPAPRQGSTASCGGRSPRIPAARQESAVEFAEMIREVQARAGFDRTPIPRLTGGVDVAGPVDGEAPEPNPVADRVARPAGRRATPSAGDPSVRLGCARWRRQRRDDRQGATGRAAAVDPRPTPRPGPGRGGDGSRSGSLAAAALVVVVGVLALGGGDDDETSPSSTIGRCDADRSVLRDPAATERRRRRRPRRRDRSRSATSCPTAWQASRSSTPTATMPAGSSAADASPGRARVRRPDAVRGAALDRIGRRVSADFGPVCSG